jgi:hypothetical protein
MNRTGRPEESLAVLLRYGSWLASATIGLGFALALIDSRFGTRNLAILPNMQIVRMGIVLFIMLPMLRVLLMLLVFIREGDFRLAAAAGFVFAIIVLGILLGLRAPSGTAGHQISARICPRSNFRGRLISMRSCRAIRPASSTSAYIKDRYWIGHSKRIAE